MLPPTNNDPNIPSNITITKKRHHFKIVEEDSVCYVSNTKDQIREMIAKLDKTQPKCNPWVIIGLVVIIFIVLIVI